MKKNLILSLLMLIAMSLSAKDIKTLIVTTTPKMHCENCENRIKGNMRFEKGVKSIETSIPDQKVIITYDADKTTPEKLVKAFEKFEYQAAPITEQSSCCQEEEQSSCCQQETEQSGCCGK